MTFFSEVLNSGSLLMAAAAASLSDPGEDVKSKNEERWAGGEFYSDYSVQCRFEALVVFSAFSVVRMHRNGRVSSLFSTELRFPKPDTVGSNPISRFTFVLSGLLPPSTPDSPG